MRVRPYFYYGIFVSDFNFSRYGFFYLSLPLFFYGLDAEYYALIFIIDIDLFGFDFAFGWLAAWNT